jgi:hypothetical protein
MSYVAVNEPMLWADTNRDFGLLAVVRAGQKVNGDEVGDRTRGASAQDIVPWG